MLRSADVLDRPHGVGAAIAGHQRVHVSFATRLMSNASGGSANAAPHSHQPACAVGQAMSDHLPSSLHAALDGPDFPGHVNGSLEIPCRSVLPMHTHRAARWNIPNPNRMPGVTLGQQLMLHHSYKMRYACTCYL